MPVFYESGYLIKVTSWENDGDHRKTKEMLVDTKDEVREIVEFCQLFSSSCNGDGIGNLCDPDDTEIANLGATFSEFRKKHPLFADYVMDCEEDSEEELEELVECYIDFAYELGLAGGEFYTGVLSKIEVAYFPEAVLYDDVTKEFVK